MKTIAPVSVQQCSREGRTTWITEASDLRWRHWPAAIMLTDIEGPDIYCPHRTIIRRDGEIAVAIYAPDDGRLHVHVLND